jgi:hypothetical protein
VTLSGRLGTPVATATDGRGEVSTGLTPPVARSAAKVCNGDDLDLVADDAVQDGVREATQYEATADTAIDFRKAHGLVED